MSLTFHPRRLDSEPRRDRAHSTAAIEREVNQRAEMAASCVNDRCAVGTASPVARSLDRKNNCGGTDMAEINSDEKVVVARSSVNVANIIAAIALLILVIGLLRFIGVRIF